MMSHARASGPCEQYRNSKQAMVPMMGFICAPRRYNPAATRKPERRCLERTPSANADNVVDQRPIAPATAPHAATVPPIRAVSHRRFGIYWLLVLVCLAAFYPLAAL